MATIAKLQAAGLRSCACTVLVLIATPVVAQQALTAAEIRSLIVGNTMSGLNEQGIDVEVYHSTDGRTGGQAKRRYFDVGKWDVTEDGKYCRQWTTWRDGKQDCFRLYRVGGAMVRIQAIEREYDGEYRILPGDPFLLKPK